MTGTGSVTEQENLSPAMTNQITGHVHVTVTNDSVRWETMTAVNENQSGSQLQ